MDRGALNEAEDLGEAKGEFVNCSDRCARARCILPPRCIHSGLALDLLNGTRRRTLDQFPQRFKGLGVVLSLSPEVEAISRSIRAMREVAVVTQVRAMGDRISPSFCASGGFRFALETELFRH